MQVRRECGRSTEPCSRKRQARDALRPRIANMHGLSLVGVGRRAAGLSGAALENWNCGRCFPRHRGAGYGPCMGRDGEYRHVRSVARPLQIVVVALMACRICSAVCSCHVQGDRYLMRRVENYPLRLAALGCLVEIEKKDVDRHPPSLVFFAPHEDTPFPGFFARQVADEQVVTPDCIRDGR